MDLTYTWTINAMYVVQSPEPNYVVTVIWTLSGTDGEYSSQIGGNTELAIEQDKPDYIPYNDLTEEIVIGWVQTSLGPTGIYNYEQNIVGQINSIINPPVSPEQAPLPWAN